MHRHGRQPPADERRRPASRRVGRAGRRDRTGAPRGQVAVVPVSWCGDGPRRGAERARPRRAGAAGASTAAGDPAVGIASTSAGTPPGSVTVARRPRRAVPARRPGRRRRRSAGRAAAARSGSRRHAAAARVSSRSRWYASSGADRRQPRSTAWPTTRAGHASGPAAADQHQRRLAVLAQVAGEPSPERHSGCWRDAVRRGQQARARGTPATTSWAKIPSATNTRDPTEVEQPARRTRPSRAMS